MKKTILTMLCLSFFFLYGSAEADKKYQIFLKYKNGKVERAVNNCRSAVGKLQSMTKIVDGTAVVRQLDNHPNRKKFKLRSKSKGKVIDEVEFSFDNMRVVYDGTDNHGGPIGYSGPVEEITFVAEIPYREGTVEEIEIVNIENGVDVVKEKMLTTMFIDESGVYRSSSGCNIVIVIIPERYEHTTAGLQRFLGEAANIRDYLMSLTPYNEFPNKVDFYWPTTVEKMTDQGCETDWENQGRGGICKEVSLYSAGCVYCHVQQIRPDYNEFYVLINEPEIYGGAALARCPYPEEDVLEGRNTFSWGTNKIGMYRFLAAHELFGHSGPHLYDEYVYLDEYGNPLTSDYPPKCVEGNCCVNCDQINYADCNEDGRVDLFDLIILIIEYVWWDCSIIPCMCDANDDEVVNIFDLLMMKEEFMQSACSWDLKPGCEECWEGCTYDNHYSCAQTCLMRFDTDHWCRRCEDIIRLWLQQCFEL